MPGGVIGRVVLGVKFKVFNLFLAEEVDSTHLLKEAIKKEGTRASLCQTKEGNVAIHPITPNSSKNTVSSHS